MLSNMQFTSMFAPTVSIPVDAEIIFVADLFESDYVGGAELTSEAIIEASPYKVFKLRSRDVSIQTIKEGLEKHWIFGNFTELRPELVPNIVANLKYSIIEYDYKYCNFRSSEKHQTATGLPCNCHNEPIGKHVSAFMQGSRSLWWMSEAQKQRYVKLFPFLAEKPNFVLSSVFSEKSLNAFKSLANNQQRENKWIVLGSQSWIKGADDAIAWCQSNNLPYEVVWNVPYDDILKMLAKAEGFVYLPKGGDTCPRMTIEAKLLGCKLQLNDNVQQKDEEWFATDDLNSIYDYLRSSKSMFWNVIKGIIDYKPSISGYVTTYNCVQQEYPFIQCIKSLQAFCEEICVVDGGSQDGTLEELVKLARPEAAECVDDCVERLRTGREEFVGNGIRIKVVKRNWMSPRFAVFDGMQKAEARAMCTGDFCWQMDSDEIVHENDAKKIIKLCDQLPPNIDLISLPVIEFWGSNKKVRVDINPWKWRLSRNRPFITHGIPKELRRYDENNELYAAPGTDGCDVIHSETGNPIEHLSFYTQQAHEFRIRALQGDAMALQRYEKWFNEMIEHLPGVYHYSWYNISRKIRLYRNYWQNHWNSLTNSNVEDIPENNMMFDMSWKNVTDEMIEARAKEFAEKLGGWIFHRKVDFSQPTPYMKISTLEPGIMLNV